MAEVQVNRGESPHGVKRRPIGRLARLGVPALVVSAAAWQVCAGLPAEGGGRFRVLIFPDDAIKVRVTLPEGTEQISGSKAMQGMGMTGVTSSNLFFQGCEVVRRGATVQLLVSDASKPLKRGKPGYIELKLLELTFADGISRKLNGGSVRLRGTDKTDSGRGKGGPALLRAEDDLTFFLMAAPAGAAAGAGMPAPAGATADAKPEVIYIPASVCVK